MSSGSKASNYSFLQMEQYGTSTTKTLMKRQVNEYVWGVLKLTVIKDYGSAFAAVTLCRE